MSKAKIVKGAQGEEAAAHFLENLGYTILHRNLRLSHLEIDLVGRDGDCLVFIEVKNSPAGAFGHPATWIGPDKQEKLRRAAERYLQRYPSPGLDIRFDVVTITKGEIEHFPNAF
jgi:putative endonuclease